MEPITSGSTTERIIRTTLVTLLTLGAAGWCFYDGYVRWPLENLRRLVGDLDPPPEVSSKLIVPDIDEQAAATVQKGVFLKELVARFGQPGWRGKNVQQHNEARFFGPAGQLLVTLDPAEKVTAVSYAPAMYKSKRDLVFQVYMGAVIGFLALLLVFHWLRVIFVKATLTDEGIRLTGRPLVPFDAVTELHAEHYARKGWVDLDYDMDGRKGALRLDDYKIKAFPQVIAEICRRKGYEDPYRKWQEQKQAAAAAK
ncbi:MAG: hypothetical protein V2A79_18025 [Planctomycetota bacterium]